MNVVKNIIFVLLALFVLSCAQHKLDFDKEARALVSCDERIKIKRINIRASEDQGMGFEIRLREDFAGSNVIYLEKENEGYYSNDDGFNFEPNTEYVITSTQGDSGLEMKVFTNAKGEIDSVQNEFSCN